MSSSDAPAAAITADDIRRLLVQQLAEQDRSPGEAVFTDINFVFDNASFENNYDRRSLGRFLWEEISEAASNIEGNIKVLFRNCTFDKFDTANPASRSVQISFDGGSAGYLAFAPTENILSVRNMTLEKTSFKKGTFQQRVSFVGTTFNKTLHCRNVTFNEIVSFRECTFGDGPSKNERMIIFLQSQFLGRLQFYKDHFRNAPIFFGSQLGSDVTFKDCVFTDKESPYAPRAYRTLKQAMTSAAADHDVLTFHALELESRANTELPSGSEVFSHPWGVEKIGSNFLRLLSNYGQDLWLPLCWLAGVGFLFFFFYHAAGGMTCIPSANPAVNDAMTWVNAVCTEEHAGYRLLIFTVRNLFGPFGLILSDDRIVPATLAVKAAGFAHLMISSIIWFIWGMQIRARYKL